MERELPPLGHRVQGSAETVQSLLGCYRYAALVAA